MKKLFLCLVTLITLAANAQTVISDSNAKPRSITGKFNEVQVSTGVELHLSQSSQTALAVSVSDEQYREGLKTEVENNILKIYYDRQQENPKFKKGVQLKVYLSVAALEKLNVNSGSSLIIDQVFSFDQCHLDLSSGAIFNGKIKANLLVFNQNSGAVANISGSATVIDLTMSSGALLKGFDLATETCTARASSGANAQLTVTKELRVRISSGAILKYKGNAEKTEIKKSSGGSVQKA